MPDPHNVTPTAGDLAFTRDDLRGTIPEAAYAGALSFMRRRFTRDLRYADVAILGIPYDLALSGRSGTRYGPRGVRTASSNIAWSGPYPWQDDPYETLAIADYGDCEFDSGRPADIPDRIADTARKILATDTALMAIGGDHFVTYPLLKAHSEKHGRLRLVQFDAHTDTWSDTAGRIDHGTMLWHATNDGVLDPARSVQVGIRTHNTDTMGFNVIPAREVHSLGPVEVARRIREIVGDGPCYITFDIDALDPSAAPGTGTPVIGGLTTWQAQEMLFHLAGLNVVGMDMVEVSPPYDHAEITALAAATLISDLLAVYAARPGGSQTR